MSDDQKLREKLAFALKQGRREFYCITYIKEVDYGPNAGKGLAGEYISFRIEFGQNGIEYSAGDREFFHENILGTLIQEAEDDLMKNKADTWLRHRLMAMRALQKIFEDVKSGALTVDAANAELREKAIEFREFYLMEKPAAENLWRFEELLRLPAPIRRGTKPDPQDGPAPPEKS